MSDYTITVVGATGKTGKHVVDEGLSRGWRVRSAARRPTAHGDWVRLSWDERDTWPGAFRGSDAAYVLIPFNHPGAPETTPDLIEAIARNGVRRIALLSSIDAEHAPLDSPLREAERAVECSPAASAILRPTWFFDNFSTGSFAAMTATGQIRLPAGGGKLPFIDTRDVAAVAAAAMTEDGPEGILPLTGPEAIDHHDLARALSEALGRRITYTPVEPEEFIQLMLSRGFSEDYSQFLADALADVATGKLTIPVWPTVEQICGRPAYGARDFARHFASHDDQLDQERLHLEAAARLRA
jgi:uncharacterized protein YbjT (DUF2867 family)